MNRAWLFKNTTELTSSTKFNLHEQNRHASRIRPLKNNFARMNQTVIVYLSFILLIVTSCSKDTKVVCVGDSITEGYGLACQSKTGYPVMLDSVLGPGYTVLNSGRSATTLQKKGDFPYWICKEFSNVFAFQPNIIIVMLGTNDTKSQNWHAASYEKDYQALIDTFKTIPTNPKIYLCLPVPVFKTKWGINDSTIVHGVIPIVQKLAKTNNLPVIDLYHQMGQQGVNFFDSIHPNEKADKVMAGIIAREIKK
jgi:alpha-L-fucosidase 2